jgi:ribosomal protein S27E
MMDLKEIKCNSCGKREAVYDTLENEIVCGYCNSYIDL